MTKPLEVSLPCCPICERVSPLPISNWQGKVWCAGPEGQIHRKVKMETRPFKEVVK